jgi:alpha-N-arabinofuranosidase
MDPETGEIRFGDNVHGRIPPAGKDIHVDYDSGPHPGFVDYYAAMKAADPSISVCSAWEKPEFVALMGNEHPYDCIGPHLYARPDVSGTPAEIHDRSIPLTEGVVGELDQLEAALAEHHPHGRRPFLEVSEYGSISLPETRPAPQGWAGSVNTTLLFADIIAGMIEHDIALAASSNLNAAGPTAGELFGGAPTFVNTARARLLALVSHLVGTRPVSSVVAGNPDATGTGAYAALRVLATRDSDGSVRLLVVNRDRERAVTAGIELPDAPAPAVVTLHTLNGPDISSYNRAADPDAVRVTTEVTSSDGELSHEFAAHSVTLVEISPT